MALTARHRFIIARLDEALLPGHEVLFEDWIRTEAILARVNSLFHPEVRGRGPAWGWPHSSSHEAPARRHLPKGGSRAQGGGHPAIVAAGAWP